MLRKIFSIQSLLWLALLLALVGSLRHVAWGFSTLESGDLVAGYVQAVAVDVGLFALAVGINQRKRQRRGTLLLWLGVLMFAALSTYANLLHGLVFKADIGLSEWPWLDIARPFALSGVLPLLVVYLSEIVGADVSYAIGQAERAAKKRAKGVSTEARDGFPMPIEEARERRKLNADQAADGLWQFVATHPDLMGMSYEQVASQYGRSRSWVSDKFRKWERAGAVQRDDGAVNVLVAERPNGQD